MNKTLFELRIYIELLFQIRGRQAFVSRTRSYIPLRL